MSYLIDRYKKADSVKKEKKFMSKIFNISIISLIITSVILLCGSVALYIIKENEIEKRKTVERQLAEVTLEKNKIAKEMEELKNTKVDLELKLALKEKEVQNYQKEIEEYHTGFDLIRTERGLLEDEKATLIKKLASIQKEFSSFKENYEQLQKAKEALEGKLKNMMGSSIKLKPIVVEPEGIAGEFEKVEELKDIEEAKATIEGEVLAVNKEYEFLVISLGLTNGINEASTVSVYRGDKLMAVCEVEKLYENISAAVIDDKDKLDEIKVGDIVVATVGEPKEKE